MPTLHCALMSMYCKIAKVQKVGWLELVLSWRVLGLAVDCLKLRFKFSHDPALALHCVLAVEVFWNGSNHQSNLKKCWKHQGEMTGSRGQEPQHSQCSLLFSAAQLRHSIPHGYPACTALSSDIQRSLSWTEGNKRLWGQKCKFKLLCQQCVHFP